MESLHQKDATLFFAVGNEPAYFSFPFNILDFLTIYKTLQNLEYCRKGLLLSWKRLKSYRTNQFELQNILFFVTGFQRFCKNTVRLDSHWLLLLKPVTKAFLWKTPVVIRTALFKSQPVFRWWSRWLHGWTLGRGICIPAERFFYIVQRDIINA